MYARRTAERELTFDFAAGLIDDNLLMVDRETRSVWSQLAGRAVEGTLEGTPLRPLAALQTTWGYWRERHPDTRVMVYEGEEGRPYLYRDSAPGERPAGSAPTSHDTSAVGLGLVVDDEAWFFPLQELASVTTPLQLQVGDRAVTVHHGPDGLTAWATDAEGELLTGVMAYEAGWRSFYPETRIFSGE